MCLPATQLLAREADNHQQVIMLVMVASPGAYPPGKAKGGIL